MLCAYKRCRSGKDVRNVSQSLRTQRQNVLPDQVRRLRTHAKVARFCCVAHQKKQPSLQYAGSLEAKGRSSHRHSSRPSSALAARCSAHG